MGSVTKQDWNGLAKALVRRRTELGFPNREDWFRDLGISDQSGPRRMIEDIETGRRVNYRDSSKAQIEIWYRWGPMSIDAVLAGQEPRINPAAHHAFVFSSEEPGPVPGTLLSMIVRMATVPDDAPPRAKWEALGAIRYFLDVALTPDVLAMSAGGKSEYELAAQDRSIQPSTGLGHQATAGEENQDPDE